MGELRSQEPTIVTIAGLSIYHWPQLVTGRPGHQMDRPESRGLFPRERRRIKVKVKLINQRETEEKLPRAEGRGRMLGAPAVARCGQ